MLNSFFSVFSALIHDADHRGVPNGRLAEEDPALAAKYEFEGKSRSLAEQNSVDLSWSILLDSKYANLRAAICQTPDEFKRFRQLVVNSVMATDM